MMDIFNMLGGMSQANQQVSNQLGTNPNQTAAALEAAVPLLLGALTRNASTPDGAAALSNALNKHDGSVLDMFSQGQMPDMQDGQKILGHVFGNQQNAAVNAVSKRAGIDPQMAMQILMMVAPLVLNYLSRQRGGANSGAQGGGFDIGSILGSILGGGMGGMLGGGQAQQQAPNSQSPNYQQGQGSILGGGPVIPGLPSNVNAGTPAQMGNMGGVIGTLNNVLDRDGDGNALDDLIGMFGGKR